MIYQIKAARALENGHPEFWQRMEMGSLDQNPMLLGYWQLYLRQAKRKGLDPRSAAEGFVKAATRPRVH